MIIAMMLAACATEDTVPAAESEQEYEFKTAESCGACHPAQLAEWQQSMHAYAAISPVFDAMASRAFESSSGNIGTFCTRCHAPIGAVNGEDGESTAQTRSDISREGVSCDYCHVAVDYYGRVGNNTLIRGNGGTKYGSIADPLESPEHYARHGEFITSSEMCGGCHDVFDEPRLEVELTYTEYLESPAADEGVRCQDCHMGPTAGVHTEREQGPAAIIDGVAYPDRELSSHRFIGPDTPMIDDFPYPDDLEASAAAQAEHRQQVKALLQRGIEISAADAESTTEGVNLTVTLRSLTSGHRVPTGFTSERQLWLQIEATDSSGAVVYRSGDLDEDTNLRDGHSHAVISGAVALDADLVNLQSRNLTRTETGEGFHDGIFAFEADEIQRHGLKPGESQAFTYRLPAGSQTIQVALQYRSMPPYVLQALDLDDLISRLPIFEIGTMKLTVPSQATD